MRQRGGEIDGTTRRRAPLLARTVSSLAPSGRWLVIANDAALLDAIADVSAASLAWLTTDHRTAQSIACNNITSIDCVDPSQAPVDVVVIDNVPDRALMRRWVAHAGAVLAAGGTLLLGGANDEGIRTAIRDATDVFGPAAEETYGARQRVARFTREAERGHPPWRDEPGIAPGTWGRRDIVIDGSPSELVTLPGVFANGELDPGTALLLEHLEVPPDGRVLDVGCGAGIIAMAAALRGAGRVDAVDVNLLAVAATARNLAEIDVPTRVFASDVFSEAGSDRYDLIVANPPFHRGKAVDFSVADRLIREAPGHLVRDGRIVIVANAFLAYGRRMERHFPSVRTIAANRRYHVLEART